MYYYCLTIAIISTILWINALYSEYISSKLENFIDDNKNTGIQRAELRTSLGIIMGLFWAAVIVYFF